MQMVIMAAAGAGLALVGIGLWREVGRRVRPQPEPPGVIRPLTAARDTPWLGGIRAAAARHPAPLLAVVESGAWLAVLITLVLHLRNPREGAVAFVVWAITIGPHEIGHVLCMPFGWFLHVAGGSIWQILAFALPAIYAFAVRRQITTSLVCWALAGHSLINLAPYIGDARARDLPLILGLSKDHHDWWNLLRTYGLLDYDHALAALATISGAGLVLGAVVLGILAAWTLPRARIGPCARFEGGFWQALRAALAAGPHP